MKMAFSSMFGYSKTELINRKVNVLMPNLYSVSHDIFLENYLNTLEFKYFKSEKLLLGKLKTGYVFPIYLTLKYVPSYVHGS